MYVLDPGPTNREKNDNCYAGHHNMHTPQRSRILATVHRHAAHDTALCDIVCVVYSVCFSSSLAYDMIMVHFFSLPHMYSDQSSGKTHGRVSSTQVHN